MLFKNETKMVTVISIIVFIGIYFLYNTSNKATLNKETQIVNWIQTNASLSKSIGFCTILVALGISFMRFGFVSALLYWLFLLMVVLSLIIVISPLKAVNLKYYLIIFLVLITFDFIF